MPFKNPEDYKNWLRDRPGYHKDKMRQYRVEGRISKSGIKYEFSEFVQFKNNPKYAQRLARELFLSDENSNRCKELEAIGIELEVSHGGPILRLKHTCVEQCAFFGHVTSWVPIEPVSYKVHFYKQGYAANRAYWIFKRYSKTVRNPDFPEVKPEFHCEKCDLRIQFQHIDDMFTFAHECRLHYAIAVYRKPDESETDETDQYCFKVGTIETNSNGSIVNGLTEQQFFDWLSRYRGVFLARNEYRIEVRSAYGP